ncbi:MAG: hypothetical protein WB869_10910, partial [Candidatus Acidiferrales bacterium]
ITATPIVDLYLPFMLHPPYVLAATYTPNDVLRTPSRLPSTAAAPPVNAALPTNPTSSHCSP